jgi:hypothetical protein
MRVFAILAAAALIVLGTGGCMRTYISRGERSPDGGNVLIVTSHGAWRRAYMDESRKLVDVWIGPLHRKSDREALYAHRYKYYGADLYWGIQWDSPQAVHVDLYDYGQGVLASDGARAGAPSNHLATLEFLVEKESGKFVEKKP